jgi:hypothetical protein
MAILTIDPVGNQPQVFEAVVATIAVDMVNLEAGVWPSPVV